MPTVYQGIVAAAHKAVRGVLGQDATIRVGGTDYSARVVFWEPSRATRIGNELDGLDAVPAVTVLHADLGDATITAGTDTVTIGAREWIVRSARADGLGRLRLALEEA